VIVYPLSSGSHKFYAGALEPEQPKKTLVFIHGAGQTAGIWQHQVDALATFAHTIAVDLPGHGRNEGSGYQRIDQYADYMTEFIESLGLKNVVLCGHSMGGGIVQELLTRPGQGFLAGILVNTGARLRVHPDFLALAREDYAEHKKQIFQYGFFPSNQHPDMEKTFFAICCQRPETAYNDYKACDSFDLMKKISDIQVPVLVVASGQDHLTPLKYGRYLAEAIPQARLQVIEQSGHHSAMENPTAFNRAIADFLVSLE
jgi:pimeloyl-ACP methyl ester carboxylesterase